MQEHASLLLPRTTLRRCCSSGISILTEGFHPNSCLNLARRLGRSNSQLRRDSNMGLEEVPSRDRITRSCLLLGLRARFASCSTLVSRPDAESCCILRSRVPKVSHKHKSDFGRLEASLTTSYLVEGPLTNGLPFSKKKRRRPPTSRVMPCVQLCQCPQSLVGVNRSPESVLTKKTGFLRRIGPGNNRGMSR